jgi:threonine dehydrogenase-like Zn-dependent dehydrogenase
MTELQVTLNFGSYVEDKSMPEGGALALKPANLSYDESAAISFGGTTALWFSRRAKIRSGDKVLINGASGGVGTAALQLTRHFGAEVTGVCSTGNLELVKSIGANKVIDYTKEDFTQNGETYDIIMDTAGTAPFSRSKRSYVDIGHKKGKCRHNPRGSSFPLTAASQSRCAVAHAKREPACVVAETFGVHQARERSTQKSAVLGGAFLTRGATGVERPRAHNAAPACR